MTDPGFKVEGISQTEPFRSRNAFFGYYTFGSEKAAVLIDPKKAELLQAAASRARPVETGGLLSGRVLRDGKGPYVLISGFVEARQGSGRMAAFHISPEAVAQLKDELARRDPTAEVVGWWHSHLRDSAYSSTDLTTQRMFSQPHSVGLLMFAACEPWARAYLGPAADDLGYPAEVIPRPRAGDAGDRTENPRPSRPADNGRPTGGGDQFRGSVLNIPDPGPMAPDAWYPTARQQGLIRLGAIIVASLLIALVAIALFVLSQLSGMSSRLGTEQRTLSGQIASANHKIATQITNTVTKPKPVIVPAVSITCTVAATSSPAEAQTPVTYDCKARGSVPGRVTWLLDKHQEGAGQALTIQVKPRPVPQQINAILKVSGREYPGIPVTVPAQPNPSSPTP